MKKLLPFIMLILCSCTMKMSDSIKAESAVIRYLDSVNKPDKVEILMTSDLFYPDNTLQEDRQILLTYISGPNYKSDTDTVVYPHIIAQRINHFKGYELFCNYRTNKFRRTALFKIDTAFKKVKYMVEINSVSE